MKTLYAMIEKLEALKEQYEERAGVLEEKDTLTEKQEAKLDGYNDIVNYLEEAIDAITNTLDTMEELKA